MSHHALRVAGGAAGIAAAFNAPLAGVVFAIEELSRRLESRMISRPLYASLAEHMLASLQPPPASVQGERPEAR